MSEAPALPPAVHGKEVKRNYALLLLPFYKKDPNGSFGKHGLTPSLTFQTLAAATPAGWDLRFWDENLLQGAPPVEPVPRVVGITVHLTFARRAYELAAWFRNHGSFVALGGPHVNSCPEEAARYADVIAVGNGSALWPEILRDVDYGTLKSAYVANFKNCFEEEPQPDRRILDAKNYLTTTSLIATRGCHNRCEFCYMSTENMRMPYQTRKPESVAAEFAAQPGPYGVFIDNNLGSNRKYLRELCAALRPVKKIWSAAVSLDVTDEPSVVEEMAAAGCNGVFIGIETLDDRNLAEARKKTPPAAEYARRLNLFHRNGIKINGSFVFGFDHDDIDVFDRTVDWIESVRMECATFHIMTPYPGTPLFAKMEAEGRLLHKNWDLYDTAHAVFIPKNMTPEELERGYDKCYARMFALPSVLKRRPVNMTDFPAYFAAYLLYKKINFLWPLLIRHRLTARFWEPFLHLEHRHYLKRNILPSIKETPEIALERNGKNMLSNVAFEKVASILFDDGRRDGRHAHGD